MITQSVWFHQYAAHVLKDHHLRSDLRAVRTTHDRRGYMYSRFSLSLSLSLSLSVGTGIAGIARVNGAKFVK